MSQISSISMDSDVRTVEIHENESAIITVRTDRHITLVFGSCTIDLFEKGGVVFTRQQYRTPTTTTQPETWSQGTSIKSPQMSQTELDNFDIDETQPMPGETQIDETQAFDYETPQSPDGLIKFSDKTFIEAIEKACSRLEEMRVDDDYDGVRGSLDGEFLFEETQREDYDSDETCEEDMFTPGGLYIPSYLR